MPITKGMFVSVHALALIGVAVAGLAAPPSAGVVWLEAQTAGNLAHLLHAIESKNASGFISRDLPNGALASLIGQQHPTAGTQQCSGINTTTAMMLLKKFGARTDTSFNGQAYPFIWHSYRSCLAAEDKAWFWQVLNQSLPATEAGATTQDYSYTNMFLMSTVNSIMFGEIVGGARGNLSASIGYKMFDTWYQYVPASFLLDVSHPNPC